MLGSGSRVRAVAGMLAVVLLSGCALTTMKTTPIWGDDHGKGLGPAEDRINLWPLLYWRDPALSVLWPLMTATDEGNAFVPLYEYHKADGDLRIGTIHPAIPPLVAHANRAEAYQRVLLAWHSSRDKEFWIFPLWFQDYGEKDPSQFLFPLVYHDKKTFWTPLWVQSDDLIGPLGGIVGRYRDGDVTQWNYLWPLVVSRHGENEFGWRAFPLADYERKGERGSASLGLLLARKDWWPTRSESSYLLGFGGASHDAEKGSSDNYLFPLWGAHKDPNASHFYSLPYVSEGDGKTTDTLVMLIGYIDHQTTNSRLQSWLWPLGTRWKDAESTGTMVIPLFVSGNDGRSRTTWVFPNLYLDNVTSQSRTQSFLFPLGWRWRSPEGSGNALFPLYLTGRDAAGVRGFYSPLASWRSDGSLRNFGMIFYTDIRKGGAHEVSVAWPLINWWSEPDRGAAGNAVLPLWYWNREGAPENQDSLLVSPLGGLHLTSQTTGYDVLGPLYFSSAARDGSRVSRNLLWPLGEQWRRGEAHGDRFFPLYWRGDDGKGERYFFSLLGGYGTGPKKDVLDVLGPLYYSSQTKARAATEGSAATSATSYRSVAWPIWHHRKTEDGFSDMLFPLYFLKREKGERAFASIPFYHWRNESETATGFALGLAGWNRDRSEDSFSHRMIPLYSWRSDPQRAEMSLGLGLVNEMEWDRRSERAVRSAMQEDAAKLLASEAWIQRMNRGDYRYTQPTSGWVNLSRRRTLLLSNAHRDLMGKLESANMITSPALAQIQRAGGRQLTAKDGTRWWSWVEESSEQHFFLLYKHTVEGPRENRNVLWRLYDSQSRPTEEGTIYTRQRVLWRLFHRETEDGRVSTDMFPFVTWDRDPEKKKFDWSFAGGLAGWSREGERKTLRVLWIPIGM